MKQQEIKKAMIPQTNQSNTTISGQNNEVSEINQLQALRNLIQNMQTNNGANNQSKYNSSSATKPANQMSSVLSNNGMGGLRAPQQNQGIPHVLDNQTYGNLSNNIVRNESEHGVNPLI